MDSVATNLERIKEERMKKVMELSCVVLLVLAAVAIPARGQEDKSQRPSPAAAAHCAFTDGKTVHIDYSSPRMKGRKIFGGLVPYGEVWRTGANEATTFVTTADVTVGDKDVPAGSYTIFTIPEANKWTLIVSKKTGEWGIPYPGEQFELVRAPMTASKTSSPVENFTISFDQAGAACTLNVEWENTRASVKISEKK
jgi:hypothetical protein